jgi:hypothetical protein
MKKKKLKLNKDTLLVLESRALHSVAGGVHVPNTPRCPTADGCTSVCPSMNGPCPQPTENCTLGCPTTPQPLP